MDSVRDYELSGSGVRDKAGSPETKKIYEAAANASKYTEMNREAKVRQKHIDTIEGLLAPTKEDDDPSRTVRLCWYCGFEHRVQSYAAHKGKCAQNAGDQITLQESAEERRKRKVENDSARKGQPYVKYKWQSKAGYTSG